MIPIGLNFKRILAKNMLKFKIKIEESEINLKELM